MQYREIKKLNAKISTFGMGCMRLPFEAGSNGDPGRIDEPLATRMVHHAIDHGVNYIDTAYVYHSERSEEVLGKAL
ncbi:MAG TPA: aldo/keto reductase, partial [Bacillota bacterium]|nr:aldo/keto reductase [Bacillota bacterium]